MSIFVSAEPLTFGLAIVASHFALFFWQAAKMTAGGNPAFGHNPEANPTRGYQLRVGHVSILGRPIRLADLLLAIHTHWPDSGVSIDAFKGAFLDSSGLHCETNGEAVYWNLRADDLREQSEETIEFFYDLLA
jgi:hypothetical protein